MKTYKIEVIMDATDEDDFIEAILALNYHELMQHIEEVKE